MTDFNKAVGTAGTMIIRDDGSTVSFIISCSDGATNTGGYTWSGVVNGVGVGGTVALGAGFGSRVLGSWTVSSSQTVSFHQNATGTSGLGGAADHSAFIARATVPPAPTPLGLDQITDSGMRYQFSSAGDGGSGIIEWQAQLDDNADFGSPVWSGWSTGTTVFTGLASNTRFYARSRGRNAVGWGAWSSVINAATYPAPNGIPASSSPTPTSINWAWNAPTGSEAILEYEFRYSTNSGFGSGVTTVSTGTTRGHNPTGLTPATTYYAQYRARNATGWSAWSSTANAQTLPATAPGMTVTPYVSGQGATVALTSPGGATGVTKYTVERRIGTGTATSTDTTSNSLSVGGLTPGTTYQWRASAWFGSYQSPWTGWVDVIQPNPNTNPGDYFDGSTAARPDLTFAWTGATNNSTSVANGISVLGWSAGSGAGGEVRLQRITGGRSGSFGGRMVIVRDLTGAGGFLGMDPAGSAAYRASVQVGAVYVGSIYVRPSRAQRLAATITWINAAGAQIGSNLVGPDTLVSNTTAWTRLIASGVAPTGAVTATVRVVDVSGTGWSLWKSGEWIDADDAMITLSTLFDWFSGDTPDAPGFDYQWLGSPNASVSARFEVPVVNMDPLADPDCPAPPAPPELPTIDTDCIDEVGTWRRYTIEIPAVEVREWSATLPTLILTTQSNAERQVRVRYYPNPLGLLPELVTQDGWEAELILTYIPPNTEIVMDGVTERVTASVNGADPISANRLLYGTGGVPATWPELRCGIGYVITMDVPLDAPAGNLDARVVVTQRM